MTKRERARQTLKDFFTWARVNGDLQLATYHKHTRRCSEGAAIVGALYGCGFRLDDLESVPERAIIDAFVQSYKVPKG